MALNKDRIQKAVDKHLRANRIEKAIAEWEAWLRENPKDWNTIRVVGDLYARVGRNEEAIKKHAAVADHYRRDGFNVRAIATHKMVLRLDPQNESAMRNLAELSAEEGLLMEAKSYYQQLLDLYSKRGHKRDAADVFRKLAAIDPRDLKIRYKFAEFLAKQGKTDEAAAEYVGIADQFIGQGLVDEAVKILQQGSAVATSEPSLKLKLAHAHSLSGNHTEAVSMLEKVRDANPGDPRVLSVLGEAYLAAGHTAEAESTLQALAQADPANTDVTLRLVELRVMQAQMDGALELLSPLLEKAISGGEGAKAAELLQKILGKDPYHIASLLKLAEIHAVLKNESARVSAYDNLCEAYSRAGDYEKAVQVAQQLVELDPETSQHSDRLKFLQSKLAPSKPEPGTGRIDDELAELTDIEEITLEEESDTVKGLRVEDLPKPEESTPQVDLGEVVELTEEDEENIKEKLTEAEVFVRYGLVDKAIAQLVDVLESFRFHTASREKLIEIYKDQGMSREAAEQLMQLAQVRDKLGEPEAADAAREEAAELSPALASKAATAEMGPEVELTPVPGSDTDFRFDEGPDVGLDEVGITVDEHVSGSAGDDHASTADDIEEDEIPIVLEEGTDEHSFPLQDESEIEVPIAEDVDVDVDVLDLGESDDESYAVGGEEIDVPFSVELEDQDEDSSGTRMPIGEQPGTDDLEGLAEIMPTDGSSELDFEDEDDEIAIDLGVNEEVPFAIDGGDEVAAADESPVSPGVFSEPEGEDVDAPLQVQVSSDSHDDVGGEGEGESQGDDIVIDIDGDVPLDSELPEQAAHSGAPGMGDLAATGDVDVDALSGAEIDASAFESSDSIDLGIDGMDGDAISEEFSVEIDDGGDEIAVEPPSDGIALDAGPSEDNAVLSPNLDITEPDTNRDIEIDIPVAPAGEAASEGPGDLDGARRIEIDEPAPDVEVPAPAPEMPVPVPVPVPSAQPPVGEAGIFESGPSAPSVAEPVPVGSRDEAPAGGRFSSELDEVDQYIALGLYEDARDTLRDLLRQEPGDASVLAKIDELGFSREQLRKETSEPAMRGAGPPVVPVPSEVSSPPPSPSPSPSPVSPAASSALGPPSESPPIELAASVASPETPAAPETPHVGANFADDGLESLVDRPSGVDGLPTDEAEPFLDLASELSDDLFGTQSAVEEEHEEPEGPLTDPGLDQIFREFRKGVEKQLGTEDYDTRYNLGIAYKEMGLLDEAIAEFQLAAKDEVRGLECCSMLGLCFMEKGMPDIAIKWFAKGLDLPGRRDEEYHGLRYDLAQAYEAAGQTDRALTLYMDIFKDNAGFRDVKDRVRELQAARK